MVSGCETLQSVQFVTVNEKRFAVIDADDWESFVDWLEELEDRQIVGKYLDGLKAAGDRQARPGRSGKRFQGKYLRRFKYVRMKPAKTVEALSESPL